MRGRIGGMDSRTENTQSDHVKCANCGASKFEWGWMHNRGTNQYELYSQMDESGIVGITGRVVKSRRCLTCNHIALFCDPHYRPLIVLPRFSLRTLLIATTLVAVVLGLIVWARS
jgi:hypothetical protein